MEFTFYFLGGEKKEKHMQKNIFLGGEKKENTWKTKKQNEQEKEKEKKKGKEKEKKRKQKKRWKLWKQRKKKIAKNKKMWDKNKKREKSIKENLKRKVKRKKRKKSIFKLLTWVNSDFTNVFWKGKRRKRKKEKKGIRENEKQKKKSRKRKWGPGVRVPTLPQLNLRGPGVPAPLVFCSAKRSWDTLTLALWLLRTSLFDVNHWWYLIFLSNPSSYAIINNALFPCKVSTLIYKSHTISIIGGDKAIISLS